MEEFLFMYSNAEFAQIVAVSRRSLYASIIAWTFIIAKFMSSQLNEFKFL